jgi:hypothetical protein
VALAEHLVGQPNGRLELFLPLGLGYSSNSGLEMIQTAQNDV